MDYCVYALSDVAGIRYIGKTKTNLVQERLRNHLKDRSKCHRVSWIASLRSKNIKPSLTVLFSALTEKEALTKEQELIKSYREQGLDLVNQTLGGDGVSGYKHSLETRRKMSATRMGHSVSKETREKLAMASKKRKGKKFKPHSVQTRQKISEANILTRGKTVIQLDNNGLAICQWPAVQQAAKILIINPSHIIAVCKNRRKTAGGFRWKYATSSL